MIRFFLWLLGHVTIMNKIGLDKDYVAMKEGYAGELYRTIGTKYNGSGKKTMFNIPQLLWLKLEGRSRRYIIALCFAPNEARVDWLFALCYAK